MISESRGPQCDGALPVTSALRYRRVLDRARRKSRLTLLGDEDYRRWFARLGMRGLARVQNSEPAVAEKRLPAFHRSEIPGRGVREFFAESSPGARAPSVRVRFVATRCDRVERLNDERSAGIEERRRAAYHVLD